MPSETNRKGDIAEQRSAADFMAKGYNVYFPLGDGYHTDYIVADADKTLRCQCKSANRIDDGRALKARLVNKMTKKEKRYEYPNVDLFIAYDHEDGDTYVVPDNYDGMYVTLRLEGRKDMPTTKWAEDFHINKFPDANVDNLKEYDPGPRRRDGGPNTVTCDGCGKEFERTPYHEKENNYCSRACFNKNRTKKLPPAEWMKKMQEQYSYRHLSRRIHIPPSTIRDRIIPLKK